MQLMNIVIYQIKLKLNLQGFIYQFMILFRINACIFIKIGLNMPLSPSYNGNDIYSISI